MNKAFIVRTDTKMYNTYFKAKEERNKFHNLAKQFFKENNLYDNAKYYQTEFLGLQLDKEQKETYKTQLKKYDDKNGMSIFKKNSKMQKLWNEQVTNNIDFIILNKQKFWYIGLYDYKCSYNMWDNNTVLYGYIDSDRENCIPSDADEIKMSQYYQIIENIENLEKSRTK